MKKVVAIVLIAVMSISILAGCSKTPGATKTGLGQTTVVSKANDATATAAGVIQADTVMAAVSIDANGKILSVTIDKVQPKATFDAAGKATLKVDTEIKTAVELGADYGMLKASGIKKEWNEQMNSLGAWMVGKTIEQVKAMKTTTKNGSAYPDEADLKTSVTVSVDGYIKVVEEAVKNAK